MPTSARIETKKVGADAHIRPERHNEGRADEGIGPYDPDDCAPVGADAHIRPERYNEGRADEGIGPYKGTKIETKGR